MDVGQERNSYTTPVLITTPQEFDSTLQQYPTFTYDLSTPSPVTGTYYKVPKNSSPKIFSSVSME